MKDLKRSVTFHMVIIGVFMMLLLIPLSMIKDLIKEREQTNKEAMEEIRKSWAYTQEIAGPVLAVPYILRDKDGNGTEHWLYFAPEKLKVKGDVTPTELYRSLYAFSVYTASVELQGEFLFPDSTSFGIAFADMLWDRALLSVQISDLKGIEEKAILVWNDNPSDFRPGVGSVNSFSNGLHAPVKIVDYIETEKKVGKGKIEKEKVTQKIERLAFSIKLKFKGSSSLFFAPLGKSTEVSLSSPWKSPNFEGAFLPTTRTVDNAGFNANWKTSVPASVRPFSGSPSFWKSMITARATERQNTDFSSSC
jgi:inner membrane protein